MPRTIGYHWVKSGYGLWLPGDDRGHWSSAWDEQIGYFEPHTLHEADPVRRRMAEERMEHVPVRLFYPMLKAVECALAQCCEKANWHPIAASLEPTHIHVLFPYTGQDIDAYLKWLAQETTKAVHLLTDHSGPVWCKGRWRQFIYDHGHWDATIRYIERHHTRPGVPSLPYSFLPSRKAANTMGGHQR